MSFKSTYILSIAFVTLIACSKDDVNDTAPVLDPVSDVAARSVEASNSFGLDIYKEIARTEQEDEQIFISPLSISMALGMLLNGSTGATQTEIISTLRQSSQDVESINRSYRELLDILPGIDPKVTKNIANSIWHEKGFVPRSSFLAINQQYLDAKTTALDFADPASVGIINDWVSDATKGLIPTIIEQINAEHVMFLVNAVYFNAEWQVPFDKKRTEKAPFRLADGSSVQVDMMASEQTPFLYLRNAIAEVVQIPYGNGQFNFTAILPAEDTRLQDIEQQLTAQQWNNWNAGLSPFGGLLKMPKFELSYSIELPAVLQAMGMQSAFNPVQADLTGIHESYELYVSDVMHKAFIRLDEEGTETGAATSIGVGVTSMPPEIVLNRAFIYIIHEKHTGAILFIGRMLNPARTS